MQQLIFEFTIIVLISGGIGIIGSMTGISGGAFKLPVLVILFALSAELAAAASLLSVIFVAVVSTIVYYRQNPQLIDFRIGGLAVFATIPGSYVGVVLRTIVAQAHLLQIAFGVILFPVALKLLFAQEDVDEHTNGQKKMLTFSQLSRQKLVMAIVSIFLAGILAGLLGLGGGSIIVPVLCIILGFPMLMAAATSMFIMIFTSSAGSLINYLILVQSPSLVAFLYYGLAMGVGMIVGGIVGPRYAARVDSVWLQNLLGFLLIFPLVKMMTLGHLWLDPGGSDYILATIGDAIIWLLIGLPAWILSSRRKSRSREYNQSNI
ncbi:MAG: sulfite exporter TauE/SafE family protein [Candidatus Thorarchaeota archaeon]